MAWTDVSTGDTIAAAHINDIHDALNGTVGKAQPMAFTEVDASATYALDVRNKDATNSLIARFRNAANEVVLSVVKEAVNTAKQIVSTVETGTAPFVVNSTTKVDNLHVARATLADTVAADSIDGDAIADDAVDSEHIADDAVDDTKVGNRVPQFYRRAGGSATAWGTAGNTTYIPTTVRMQAGVIAANLQGMYVGIPVAFSNTPIVLLTVVEPLSESAPVVWADEVSNNAFRLYSNVADPVTNPIQVAWLAIGPES